jgi:ABC-type branched-subunit amino acid transport system permease subunit
VWGALLGSWFYVYANDKITNAKTSIGGHELREFRPIIFGIILILVMIALPDGIIGSGRSCVALSAAIRSRSCPTGCRYYSASPVR